jgi:hypothetical protein
MDTDNGNTPVDDRQGPNEDIPSTPAPSKWPYRTNQCKGVSECKFRTWGRGGGDLCQRLKIYFWHANFGQFWPKSTKLRPSRTPLSSRMCKLCLQSYYILYLYCLKSNVTWGDIYNNMCDDVTYNYISYSRNHVIKTYHIWTKHTLFRRRGGGGGHQGAE